MKKFKENKAVKVALMKQKRSILTDGKSHLKVAVQGGFIHLEEIQLAGKTRMAISDFLRGFQMKETLSIH